MRTRKFLLLHPSTKLRNHFTNYFSKSLPARGKKVSCFRTGDCLFNGVPHRFGARIPIPFEPGGKCFLACRGVKFFVGEQAMDAVGEAGEISWRRFEPDRKSTRL